MRRFLLSLLTLTLAISAVAQAKHPFTFEDMMKLKRVGDPQVSPDGKWVIFSVVDVDLEANTKTPHIWIVPLSQTQGPSTPQNASPSTNHPAPVGMTGEREIISDQDGDRPRWAPDGKRFAFLSTKEGGSQVWIAEFDTSSGSVTKLSQFTHIATEAAGELWSPDGHFILFTSDVYPECDGRIDREIECNAKKLKEGEQSKVKALIFDHLLYRHWNAYKEGRRSHIFVFEVTPDLSGAFAQSTELHDINIILHNYDLTPGDYDAPVFSLGGQDNYAFSPDGHEICYTSNHDKNEAASTNNDLWIVPVSGGPAKNITADNPASDSTPLYSPDGRYIAYRAQQRPGYESDQFHLVIYERNTGEKKNLTDLYGLVLWVGTYTWSPDSKKIYFASEQAGGSNIFVERIDPSSSSSAGEWPLPGGARNVALIMGFSNDDVTLGPNGKSVLFTRTSASAPVEIYVASTKGGECKTGSVEVPGKGTMSTISCAPPQTQQLTHFNDAILSQVDMAPIEPFRFVGAHGDTVQGFLVKPPNFDASKKYPVKFLIHGGPQGAWGNDWSYRWNAELFAAPTASQSSGYVVIMINFHGSNGYGQKFMDAINGDWGGAPYEDLMKGLDYAEQTYPFIDKNRECALGASYGGYMTNWILGHTDRFKCIVTHDGMFNPFSAWGTTEELWFNNWEFGGTPYTAHDTYNKWSPRNSAMNFKTPTLVVHGQRDYRLDVSEGFQLFTTLQTMGVPSKMLYFPDEGHWVLKPQNSKLWYETVNAWVDQWTK